MDNSCIRQGEPASSGEEPEMRFASSTANIPPSPELLIPPSRSTAPFGLSMKTACRIQPEFTNLSKTFPWRSNTRSLEGHQVVWCAAMAIFVCPPQRNVLQSQIPSVNEYSPARKEVVSRGWNCQRSRPLGEKKWRLSPRTSSAKTLTNTPAAPFPSTCGTIML